MHISLPSLHMVKHSLKKHTYKVLPRSCRKGRYLQRNDQLEICKWTETSCQQIGHFEAAVAWNRTGDQRVTWFKKTQHFWAPKSQHFLGCWAKTVSTKTRNMEHFRTRQIKTKTKESSKQNICIVKIRVAFCLYFARRSGVFRSVQAWENSRYIATPHHWFSREKDVGATRGEIPY